MRELNKELTLGELFRETHIHCVALLVCLFSLQNEFTHDIRRNRASTHNRKVTIALMLVRMTFHHRLWVTLTRAAYMGWGLTTQLVVCFLHL